MTVDIVVPCVLDVACRWAVLTYYTSLFVNDLLFNSVITSVIGNCWLNFAEQHSAHHSTETAASDFKEFDGRDLAAVARLVGRVRRRRSRAVNRKMHSSWRLRAVLTMSANVVWCLVSCRCKEDDRSMLGDVVWGLVPSRWVCDMVFRKHRQYDNQLQHGPCNANES